MIVTMTDVLRNSKILQFQACVKVILCSSGILGTDQNNSEKELWVLRNESYLELISKGRIYVNSSFFVIWLKQNQKT
mgnify:CR=1 FL=1